MVASAVASFIRKVRTASGARAVQVVHKQGRQVVGIEHIGSAHDDSQLAVLMGLYAVRGEGAGSRRWDVEGSWPAGMGVVETSKDQRTTSRVRAYGFAA